MVSDKVNFDFGADLEDSNYKSYFARSMAVSSHMQYKESRSLDFRHGQLQSHENSIDLNKGNYSNQRGMGKAMHELPEVVRLRKDLQLHSEDVNRLSYSSNNSSRRASLCSNRMIDNPVENFVLQSQLDTLQWQLKETESSREMYRAVMRQVVTFLERAHRSLELLGSRINTRVPRPQSEYHMNSTRTNGTYNETITENMPVTESEMETYREFEWRRSKKQEPTTEEIPPDKLSQEAFRLLRTAQSLLSTHEPDLAHINNSEEDLHFLTQLAKEFPQPPEIKPIRTTSFSMSPKLLTPEKDARISTAFNRKLSLQLNDNLRRNSFLKDVSSKLNRSNESSRSSVTESDCIPLLDDFRSIKAGNTKYEKSNSPPVSSVGSAEDESGFSSMNSFQEVGLPHPHSNHEDAKEALLKSMLHTNGYTQNCHNDFFDKPALDDIKLWETTTTTNNILHKRWGSTPVDNLAADKAAIKVLWV